MFVATQHAGSGAGPLGCFCTLSSVTSRVMRGPITRTAIEDIGKSARIVFEHIRFLDSISGFLQCSPGSSTVCAPMQCVGKHRTAGLYRDGVLDYILKCADGRSKYRMIQDRLVESSTYPCLALLRSRHIDNWQAHISVGVAIKHATAVRDRSSERPAHVYSVRHQVR